MPYDVSLNPGSEGDGLAEIGESFNVLLTDFPVDVEVDVEIPAQVEVMVEIETEIEGTKEVTVNIPVEISYEETSVVTTTRTGPGS
jgi:hypothetical protein